METMFLDVVLMVRSVVIFQPYSLSSAIYTLYLFILIYILWNDASNSGPVFRWLRNKASGTGHSADGRHRVDAARVGT